MSSSKFPILHLTYFPDIRRDIAKDSLSTLETLLPYIAQLFPSSCQFFPGHPSRIDPNDPPNHLHAAWRTDFDNTAASDEFSDDIWEDMIRKIAVPFMTIYKYISFKPNDETWNDQVLSELIKFADVLSGCPAPSRSLSLEDLKVHVFNRLGKGHVPPVRHGWPSAARYYEMGRIRDTKKAAINELFGMINFKAEPSPSALPEGFTGKYRHNS
ncbi:hypothetical protein HDU76_004119 [Blyttiomyces sp. JEL0837]|nr:hypothetical protein HDU76_004119 [Blyttiomyces sp. JEL0837]